MADKLQLSDKAARYIDQLSTARCDARWSEASELARKVEKHAPWKNCLATAARTEARFEQQIDADPRGGPKPPNIRESVETVLNSVKESKATPEEVFQARTCIQWLHWVDGEWDSAILCIAPDAVSTIESGMGKKLCAWTEVCIVKSAFVRGASLEVRGREDEALLVYQEAVARSLTTQSPAKDTLQYKLWLERLLNRYARLSEPPAESEDGTSDDIMKSLEAFRAWARLGVKERSVAGLATGGLAVEERFSRRGTWMLYYKLLSSLVHRVSGSHPTHTSLHVSDVAIASRLELCTEVQRVEHVYDSLLIQEVAFPEAHEYNNEVDDWADLVMSNWAVFVGPAWNPEDVPQSKKRLLSQRMLDILYRGATRTFHSMTILRHLSAVHASLGEFELAVKALNSYVTIGIKAKARIQKSGEVEPGIDSDDVFVSAIAVGIEMLCVFGVRKEVTRAQELSTLLQQTLDEDTSLKSPTSPKSPQQADQEKLAQSNIHVAIHSRTLSLAHRAIGISFARWSFLTFEPAKRSDLQQTSLSYLRKSLRGSPGNETNLEALYALSLIAAESRETQRAIAAVKQALLQSTNLDQDSQSLGPTAVRRPLRPTTSAVRCWHLLTLLLSSRQDYDNAADSSDEGLELLTKRLTAPHSLVTLDTAEKRSMLSLRMSRIALKELLEGPEAAVNDSMTLLTLYGEIFKSNPKGETKSSEHLSAPNAVPGRTLSMRASFWGRGRAERSSQVGTNAAASKSQRRFSESSAHQAPTLKVPDGAVEDPRPTTSRSHRSLSRSGSKRLQKRPSKRSVNRPGSAVRQQPRTEGGETSIAVDNVNRSAVTAAPPHLSPVEVGNNLQNEVGLAVSKDLEIDAMSTLPETEEPRQAIVQSLTVHYSDIEEARRAKEVLIEIWVFIAGLYRRAGLYSDCASACIESLKQVRSLESAVASVKATAEELARPGWGGAKSVEELKADALAERGHLELAISGARSAKENYESALTHFPDHVGATVGLANILLDVYAGETPSRGISSKEPAIEDALPAGKTSISRPVLAIVPGVASSHRISDKGGVAARTSDGDVHKENEQRKSSTSPEALDKLAARDRAFNMLSALSKLGTGWDQSEVWFALARAYELSGQLDKAQEALWWVVELEKKRPIRHWGCLGQGYSLWY